MDTQRQKETDVGKEAEEGERGLAEERGREKAGKGSWQLEEWAASHFASDFCFQESRGSRCLFTWGLSATPWSRAATDAATDAQLTLITEPATSAQHGLRQFYNGWNPLELISDEEINLLTGQIYSIQITIDPFSTQLIKTFLAWPSTLCTLKQIISNKQVLWGPKENVNQ